MTLPYRLVERAQNARLILEIGAGDDFSTASELAGVGCRVVVTDIDPKVLRAPPPLLAKILDVTRAFDAPAADLVIAVRLPEELQLAAARLANSLSADLAVRALKDEWADVSKERRKFVVWGDGWRYYPSK